MVVGGMDVVLVHLGLVSAVTVFTVIAESV